MPCYNEEKVLHLSIPPILNVLKELNISHEVILVNNGSCDSTPAIIDSFSAEGFPVRRIDVSVNVGYGWGVICGLNNAKGKYIGYMSSDGQVKPDDVSRLFKLIKDREKGVLVTAIRIDRADGWQRVLVSRIYNLLLTIFYGRVGHDANGTPRFLHHDDLAAIKPVNRGSFVDPEILIKSKKLNIKLIEVPIVFYKRQGGSSSVRVLSKSIEFLKDMIEFRFSREYKEWLTKARVNG